MSHYSLPEIETPRLRLRIYRAADAPTVHSIWLDPDVLRYFSPISRERSEQEVLEVLLRTHARWRERGFSQWGVTLKSDVADADQVIGYCGFQPLEQSGEVELYYGFPAAHWNKGLATEAARAALRYAFETLKLPRVVAVTNPDNKASHRVLEKAGMRFEAKKHFYDIDVFYFAVDAHEFAASDTFYKLNLSEAESSI